MSKRRSKKDKQKARSHQQQTQKTVSRKDEAIVLDKIFSYDLDLIKKDLRKTIVVTFIILLVLAIISLRYT